MLFGLNPNSLYQSYLDTYMDEYNARNQDLGIASLTSVTPVGTPINIRDGDNVSPPGPTTTSNMSLGEGLKTAAKMLAFGPTYGVGLAVNKGVESITGRSLTDRISDAMKGIGSLLSSPNPNATTLGGDGFGGGGTGGVTTDTVGGVGLGGAPPGVGPGETTSDASSGGSAGADAASAAGANDGPDTGGSFQVEFQQFC